MVTKQKYIKPTTTVLTTQSENLLCASGNEHQRPLCRPPHHHHWGDCHWGTNWCNEDEGDYED